MDKLLNFKIVLAVPLLIVTAMIAFVSTPFFLSHQAILSKALTIDLVFAVPFIYYFLIRKKEISKFSTITIGLICITIGTFIIPENHQQLLSSIKHFALPISEILVIGVVIIKAYRLRTNFKTTEDSGLGWYERVKLSSQEELSHRFTEILITELSMLYYLLCPIKKVAFKYNEYTYFKRNGLKEIVFAFIFIITIESAVAHYLLYLWSPLFANLCSLSSLYLIVFMISILRSTKYNPITINSDSKTIRLQFGFMNQSTLRIEDIVSIVKSRNSSDHDLVKHSPFKEFTGHNIIVELAASQKMKKLYGFEIEFNKIGIYVDDPDSFIAEVNSIISTT